MSPTNAQEISNQAAVMLATGKPVSDQVKAFERYLSVILTQTCQHPNGHITQDAAARCGIARAETELALQPASVDMDARLASVAVTITTQARFQCNKGCKFGHKTQAQAQACSTGRPGSAAKAIKASIKVGVASLPNPTQEATQATQEATQDPKATQEATPKPQATPKPTPKPKASLKASQGGNTGKA